MTARPTVDELIAADIAYLSAGADPAGYEPAGSGFCNSVGFDADRFAGYLWRDGAVCWLSLIVSKQPGRGHFSEVLRELRARGYELRVPNPQDDMRAILSAWGFTPMAEDPLCWALQPAM